jgi:hypothetical protein
MRRLQLWAGSLAVCLGLAGTAAGQAVDNPMYKMWAVWSEGTSVTLKTVQADDGEMPVTAKQTQTVKKVTADKVVIEFAYVTEVGGMTFQAPPQSMDIPAKVPVLADVLKGLGKAAPQGTPQPTSKSKETKGRETLTVNGKKLDCEWVQHVDEDGSVSKVWSCDDVPGGTVKVEAKRPGSTGTTLVVEWKGTKK